MLPWDDCTIVRDQALAARVGRSPAKRAMARCSAVRQPGGAQAKVEAPWHAAGFMVRRYYPGLIHMQGGQTKDGTFRFVSCAQEKLRGWGS
jgi:hypothetical protein